MKKVLFVLMFGFLSVCLFAQEGDVKPIYPAVWEVMLNIDGNYLVSVEKADVASEVYLLNFISYQKVLMSNQAVRYIAEYKVENGKIVCNVPKMETANVDGNRKPTSAWKSNMKSSMTKMATNLSDRANAVFANTESYNSYKEKTLIDPTFLYNLTANAPSTLWAKKFIENSGLIGKNAEIKVTIRSIDESKYNDRAYVVTGDVIVNFIKNDTVAIKLYTNDDNVALLKTKQEYVLKGTVLDYFMSPLNVINVLNLIQ